MSKNIAVFLTEEMSTILSFGNNNTNASDAGKKSDGINVRTESYFFMTGLSLFCLHYSRGAVGKHNYQTVFRDI